ncbi:imidazolonepropionase [Paracoccus sp. Z330]|uniref:Imidazolonepropionase n=1 Tax=Paracoccus onchidii TaxID=3017813 RepID=A0ABT4ZA15_9RHOB|nr:imidazolonepropionase [Paracoccus onchidii]MDB6176203.1 imidazolonepropionase [Paracoccus onchidii]
MNKTVDLIVAHAGELLTCAGPDTGVAGSQLQELEIIRDGAIAIKDGRIVATGASSAILSQYTATQQVDAQGALVSPALIDPHTHLVHMGSREAELDARASGGGIANGISTGGIRATIEATSSASNDALKQRAIGVLDQMLLNGTATVEAKTGYGADMAQELRLLKVTRSLDCEHPVEVIPTFLGAHIPPAHDREGFVQSVIDAIPAAAALSEFCDIACDSVCFDYDESDRIAEVATSHGMKLRIHANQASPWRGLELAAKWKAASADHGDYALPQELAQLAKAGVVLVLLPGANFHMLETTTAVDGDTILAAAKPHLPQTAARLMQSGCVPSVGTNYNPGSSPCLSMQMMMQLLPRMFRIGFAATWYMATLNAAASLGRATRTGSLQPGKDANFIVWNVQTHGQVINQFGGNHVRDVWISGRKVVSDRNISFRTTG